MSAGSGAGEVSRTCAPVRCEGRGARRGLRAQERAEGRAGAGLAPPPGAPRSRRALRAGSGAPARPWSAPLGAASHLPVSKYPLLGLLENEGHPKAAPSYWGDCDWRNLGAQELGNSLGDIARPPSPKKEKCKRGAS